MGDIAVASGQATTASPTEPAEPVGVTVAPVLEPDMTHEVVHYDGHNMTYANIQNKKAEIVGSTTVGEDQHIIIVRNATAPTTYRFRLTAEESAFGHTVRMSTNVPGAAEVVTADGSIVATIAKPWARTASGGVVPSSFSISAGKLVQTIATAGLPVSAFPVTADPSVTRNCGITTCTWYFSVKRSKKLADDSLNTQGAIAGGSAAALICALIGVAASGAPGFNVLLALVCGALTTAIITSYQNNLSDARTRKRCFTVSTPPRGMFGNVAQSNKYCHLK